MKWNKAKNLIIIFLIIMNVFLYFQNYYLNKKYTLTLQQEKNIITLLGENKISMYVNIPNKSFPMSSLIISPSLSDYDRKTIATNFLGEEGYNFSTYKGIDTYKKEGTTITFEDGFFRLFFDEPIKYEENPKELLEKFEKPISDFVLDKVTVEDGFTIYEYREKYKDIIVFTNRVEISTKDGEAYSIIGFFGDNEGLGDKPKDIISVDMALFTFMKTAKEIYGDKELFIEGVDIVYYQEEYFPYSKNDYNTSAMPCYRIYIQDQSIPFIINGYTNKVVNY